MRHRNRRIDGGGERSPLVDPLFAEALSSTRRDRRDVRQERKTSHKTMQLCRQAQRALMLALAGECGDQLLREVYVDAVVPAPDASRLLVRLIVPARSNASAGDVMQRLEGVAGKLRAHVARAITRKRAPELTFIAVGEPEVLP